MLPFLGKQSRKPKGLCCISFNMDGIAFANIKNFKDLTPEISICDFIPCDSPLNYSSTLKTYIKKNDLEGAYCACVLNPNDYRLLLLDSPNVPEEELKQATRFLIKDLIDFPIEEAAIDIFPIPSLSNKKTKLYVVASQMKALQKLTQYIEQSGLTCCYIDIFELALRNIASLWKKDDCVALFFMNHNSIYVIIVYKEDLCFTRKIIDIQNSISETSSIDFDNLSSELIKSFDYYQSQVYNITPSKILLTPMITHYPNFSQELTASLGMSVEEIDLNSLFKLPKSLDKNIQTHCLPVLAECLKMNEIFEDIEELI